MPKPSRRTITVKTRPGFSAVAAALASPFPTASPFLFAYPAKDMRSVATLLTEPTTFVMGYGRSADVSIEQAGDIIHNEEDER